MDVSRYLSTAKSCFGAAEELKKYLYPARVQDSVLTAGVTSFPGHQSVIFLAGVNSVMYTGDMLRETSYI